MSGFSKCSRSGLLTFFLTTTDHEKPKPKPQRLARNATDSNVLILSKVLIITLSKNPGKFGFRDPSPTSKVM